MNILITMAGSDFNLQENVNETQYMRNLYEIENKISFQYIYESLYKIQNINFIVVMKREDVIKYHFDNIVKLMIPNVKIIISNGTTQGAGCSALLAVDYIADQEPLLISSSNLIITHNWQTIINDFRSKNYDGATVIFQSFHPRWSFVKLDKNDMVVEASEKCPISSNATTGHFFYRSGEMFVESVKKMIRKRAMINEQYYVCPVFNEMILQQKRIGVYRIKREEVFYLYDQKGINEFKEYLRGKKYETIQVG